MKRTIILLLIAISWLPHALAQQDSVFENKKNDTVVITEWEDTPAGETTDAATNKRQMNSINAFPFSSDDVIHSSIGIAVLTIVLIFGLPFFIIFLVFFFKYKNKQAKYKLIEQALASGQPLPEDFIKQINGTAARSNGIANIFTGLGLFIFLWAVTGEFGVGCIGLLILCIGAGQAITHHLQKSEENKQRNNRTEQ